MSAPRASAGPKRPPRPERPAAEPWKNGAGSSSSAAATQAAPPAEPEAPASRDLGGFAPAAVASFASPSNTVIAERPVAVPVAPMAEPVTSPTPKITPSGKRVRRGRRVKRVVRRIDLWSVLKLALIVYTCLYLAVLATLAALWGILYSSGNVAKLQSFLEDVGLENFTFYGNQMFRACAAVGAVGVLAGTVITVLATALVNVISEMTGGIRLIVIEEDVDG